MTTLIGDRADSSRFGGIYDVPEAARYLRAGSDWAGRYSLSSRKLIYWIRRGISLPAPTHARALDLLLGFEELISMRMIAALRAAGYAWREIREADRILRQMRGTRYPFATEVIWTGQGELYAEWEEHLVSGSRHGQAALDLIRDYVRPFNGLEFSDESNLAISWEPSKGVVLKPQVQFGAPCIKNTRIPTRSISGMIDAGDSPDWVAQAYGISREAVHEAYEWESQLRTV